MNTQLSQWYSHQGMATALTIYKFPEEYKYRPSLRVLALRYIFQHRLVSKWPCPSIQELVEKATLMFDDFAVQNDTENLYEIADIIGTHSPNNRNIFLQRIRNIENPAPLREALLPREAKNSKKTVYDDSQNVHNSKINQSVLKVAEFLYKKYENVVNLNDKNISKEENARYKANIIENIRCALIAKYPDKRTLINNSTRYIQESVALFGVHQISLIDSFISLWLFITDHEHITELESRLLDELKEMNGLCTTGHIARLMNVIQGFTSDENLCIRISDTDQCNAVIKTYLTSVLAKCEDEKVTDGMTNGGDEYVAFLRLKVAEKLLSWEKEYGKEMLDNIAILVNNFAGTDVFEV